MENSESLKTNRRSLYYAVYPEEGGGSPLGELFDGPDALECYRRTRTIVPQQALALTNSDFVHQVSAAIVNDWEQGRGAEESEPQRFIVEMFERILSRQPSPAELTVCLNAYRKHPELAAGQSAKQVTRARESIVRAILNHNDFVTIR